MGTEHEHGGGELTRELTKNEAPTLWSPQMSAVAAVAGLGCGQDTVTPPIDVPESEGWEEKRRQESDSSVFEGLSNPEISPVIPGG